MGLFLNPNYGCRHLSSRFGPVADIPDFQMSAPPGCTAELHSVKQQLLVPHILDYAARQSVLTAQLQEERRPPRLADWLVCSTPRCVFPRVSAAARSCCC